MARNLSVALLSCIPLLLALTPAVAEQIPVANAEQLSRLRGYCPDSLTVEDKGHELSADALMSAIKARLRDASLLATPAPDVARLHATVFVMAEHDGRQGWWTCLQLREAVRLVRQPESGAVSAVTWYQCASEVVEQESLRDRISAALAHLTDRLISAHARQGELLP